ncbi:pyridoxamine 5'-phosphate oxidase family protein [Bacillus sp. MMSF_3328]|uniref:pyridoxamine 5'-phosphate oxidase family protein n=1 Tax=Bacillus sp. MMSF_3328 TaxID=3047080 RepID=UPI00273D8B9B|nr:pyridoxamine 5'-phosphate oxidase family protein [Bacillus sp. MMSF_3328]
MTDYKGKKIVRSEMTMADTKQKVLDMFEKYSIGTLASIRNDRPYSRFMLFFHDDLILFAATDKDAHKVEDIEKNPNVHILLGVEQGGYDGPYCEIEAKASFEDSGELKKKFWSEKLKDWLSGPDDPDYLLLKMEPSLIRYFEKAGAEPEELSL